MVVALVRGYKEVGRKAGGNQLEVGRSSCCKLAGSSFLNSLVPKKVSAQQIADEITRSLSLSPDPARHQSDSFALQLRLTGGKVGICRPARGNFCYGERELTFESYTWGESGSRRSLQLHLDRDAGDKHNQMRDDLHMSQLEYVAISNYILVILKYFFFA